MIFDFITITGADDNVEQIFLEDMSTQYPHVEWGILFSTSRQGSPRYPSHEWITRLVYDFYPKWDTSFSAHICGSMCERIVRDVDLAFFEEQIGPLFSRIQLNSFPELSDMPENILALATYLDPAEIVLPIPNDHVAEICRSLMGVNISFLHDKSRGRGKSPSEWPTTTLDDAYVGFAGGINPENIREVLDMLCGLPGNLHFWLDLESGARTDDQMDVKKVEKILKITEEFL